MATIWRCYKFHLIYLWNVGSPLWIQILNMNLMLNHIKKLCLTFYRMGTNLNPLWVLKKYGSSKAIEEETTFQYSLWWWEVGEQEFYLFKKKIESTQNLMKSLNINFLYALGTIPFGMLGHMCLRPIIWDTYGIDLYIRTTSIHAENQHQNS